MSRRSNRHVGPAVVLPRNEHPQLAGTAPARALRMDTSRVVAASEAEGPERQSPHLPEKPEEMSWSDYLVMLLHIAAELEHALMVEYLYAAYSLGGSGVGAHTDVVRGWHDELVTIAREEMGHLLSVQNALILLGAPVSFERDDYPWSGPFNAFPFELERLTLLSLAKYVYSEMPADDAISGPDVAVAQRVHELVGDSAGARVGQVYERIIALVEDPRRVPESSFHPETYASQADWDEWGRSYRPESHKPYAANPDIPPPHSRKTTVMVTKVATRTELAASLRDIASQGEAEHLGRKPKAAPSHFDRFAAMFRRYEAILAVEPDWSPSRLVAVNPVVTAAGASAPAGATPITAPDSRTWASLFNIRYRILLTLLTYASTGPRERPEVAEQRRAAVVSRVFGEMYNLKAISGVLVRLPLGDPERPERAGPPFQMPYTLVLPPETSFWRSQIDLLDSSDQLARELLDEPRVLPDGKRYLLALREADATARTWIEQLLTGLTGKKTKKRRA